MVHKKAIVTGIGGQDGFWMSLFLARKGYSVVGLTHNRLSEEDEKAIKDNGITVRSLDFAQYRQLGALVEDVRPDEVYNFAAQSSSIGSWEDTINTLELNLMAPAMILQGIRDHQPKCRFFQASSCEVFGKEPVESPQTEMTKFSPETPYATAKAAVAELIKNYRDHYGIFAINALFYNHESIRRNIAFLPSKIARTVAKIHLGKENCLKVGNIDSKRDWGYSPDYVEAAWRAMQLDKADDYVFATGVQHTVREMIEIAFSAIDITLTWQGNGVEEVGSSQYGKELVKIDPKYFREYDRSNSVGDASKLWDAIGWKPVTSFDEMIRSMVQHYIMADI